MISRKLIGCVFFSFALLLAGCSSKPADKTASSLPPSGQTNKTPASTETPAPPPSSPNQPGDKKSTDDKSVTYASNPEKFVKYPTEQPPFNIKNPKTAQEHFNVGVYLDNQKQYGKALDEYGKAVEQKPDWALAHMRMAHDYDRLGKEDDAIAQWNLAVKYDPQFYSAYDELAAAYERQGNLPKAIEAYSALLKYPPAQLPVHYQLGLWYAKLGDRANARTHLQQYLQLASKIPAEKQSPRFQTATQTLQTVQK